MEILVTLAAALIGGVLFYSLNVPLPWTLGPIAAILFLKVYLARPARWPSSYRNAAMAVLGFIMGSPFTAETAKEIGAHLPVMLTATVLTLAVSMFMGYVIHRRAGISLASALLGSTPGGLSQMVLLSEEVKEADLSTVTFMQTTRVLAVVFSVPFLVLHGLADTVDRSVISAANGVNSDLTVYGLYAAAVVIGVIVAVKIKLPTPYMLGPTLATAFLAANGWVPPKLPYWLVAAAQISAGIYMGLGINPENLTNWRRLLPYTFINVGVVLVFSLALGLALSKLYHYSIVTGFLGTAPGGIAEMGLTAMMVNADLSVVISYQMFRLLFILLVVPPILKWLLTR